MPSDPTLDFDSLIAPIEGDNPAGSSVPYETKEQLEEMRKEIDPASFAEDDPMRPEQPKLADWQGIIELAKQTLTSTSKDLLVAARLTEALVRVHGFAGLRDGLHLMQLLIEQCWDRLNPPIEEGDMDLRTPFIWLDAPDKRPFPNTVRQVPFIQGAEGKYSLLDRKLIMEGRGAIPAEDLDKALANTPLNDCKEAVEDLDECLRTLQGLGQSLNEKMGPSAPGMTGLRAAVEECRHVLQQMIRKKAAEGPPSGEEVPGEEGASGQGLTAGGALTADRRPLASRAEAYRQLAQVASLLRQLEPHSPIPYLLERAVELGSLPFPELIRALIRDPNVLNELNREMGDQTIGIDVGA